jgi:hypothetical protein
LNPDRRGEKPATERLNCVFWEVETVALLETDVNGKKRRRE